MERKILEFSLYDPAIARLSTRATDPQFMIEKGSLAFDGKGPTKNALDSLTPRQRQILWLRFHPDRHGQVPTIEAVRKEIGCSRSTVKRDLRAALAEIPDPNKLYFPQR